eukprot:GHVR01093214.1.p2 GENE.GHVR01093214.1~~GHVR01093214.1.p2  ORF type:complete len:121 (+),score=65.84 GHVR01093214.1:738-1100(+)
MLPYKCAVKWKSRPRVSGRGELCSDVMIEVKSSMPPRDLWSKGGGQSNTSTAVPHKHTQPLKLPEVYNNTHTHTHTYTHTHTHTHAIVRIEGDTPTGGSASVAKRPLQFDELFIPRKKRK